MSLASLEIGGESGILKFVFQFDILEHVSAGFSDKNGGYPILVNNTILSSHKGLPQVTTSQPLDHTLF
jgi:hypothetical protein